MDAEYESKKQTLLLCRNLAYKLFTEPNEADRWLESKSDSFWDMSPIECIQSGRGDEVVKILEAKLQAIRAPVTAENFSDNKNPVSS